MNISSRNPVGFSAVLFVLGTASACGGSEGPTSTHRADDGTFAASTETRGALGVVEWKINPSEYAGYDENGQRVLGLRYRATYTSPTESVLELILDEPGRTSTAAVAVAANGVGTATIAATAANFPDRSGSARTLSFLQHDFGAVARSVPSDMSTRTLEPLEEGELVDGDVRLDREVSCDLYGPKNPVVIKIATWTTTTDVLIGRGVVLSEEVETCYTLGGASCVGKHVGSCKNAGGVLEPTPPKPKPKALRPAAYLAR